MECFVICQFGEEGSDERRRSDKVFENFIKKTAQASGYKAFRSIDLEGNRPGVITENVIDKLCNADLVIADLTGSNANVYYELALRHATGKPFIMLVEDLAEVKFDVQAFTTIAIRWDYVGGKKTEAEIENQMRLIKESSGRLENPVSRKFPHESKMAKVFIWTITYSQGLADSWLQRQDQTFIKCAKAFDNNKVGPDNPGLRNRLAHYVAFKWSQGQAVSGRLYYHHVGADLVEGWGNFELPGSEPMAIRIIGKEIGANEVEIKFTQPGRPLEIAQGITERIQNFNYSVKFARRGRILDGALYHPDYLDPNPLLIGMTQLSPIE
jgi:hypothetical protein